MSEYVGARRQVAREHWEDKKFQKEILAATERDRGVDMSIRAELTWKGEPPKIRPVGECLLTTVHPGRRIRIDQADPRIMISAELLDEMRAGHHNPHVTLNDDVLRIEGVNRTVVYRIGDQVPDLFAYYAEWPD